MKLRVKEASTLIEFLLLKLDPISRTRAKKMLHNGNISVNGTVQTKAGQSLRKGDIVEVLRGERLPEKREAPVDILYEDRHLIAAVKPAGLLSISTEKEKINTFYRMVSDHVKAAAGGKDKIFIVHRLDREASGVMLFAKNKNIKDKLQKNWDRTEKVYYALVEGHPPKNSDTIKNYLCENKAHFVYICPEGTPGAQLAITHYKSIKNYRDNALLELRIETGRKNQIRVHLAGLGTPVSGDRKYGAKEKRGRMYLHASGLGFYHPVTGKKITLKCPVPESFFRN